MQLSWRRTDARNRHVTLSMTAYNVLAGVDALVHGGVARGWGQPSHPDAALLQVKSFDPDAPAFGYEVNQRFGSRSGVRSPLRIPFQLALHVRLELGGTP
jgi:hypothetical protein